MTGDRCVLRSNMPPLPREKEITNLSFTGVWNCYKYHFFSLFSSNIRGSPEVKLLFPFLLSIGHQIRALRLLGRHLSTELYPRLILNSLSFRYSGWGNPALPVSPAITCYSDAPGWPSASCHAICYFLF